MTEIEQSIKDKLHKIEEEENIEIFYACETGSRAWGFESEDSDFDVRFLYLHPRNWYLTIENKKDVIERPINNNLDISGWDIRKTLILFRKSNPPLLEWLQSSIVYKKSFTITDQIRRLMPEYYSPRSCLYHYLHMAQGNYRHYLKGGEVWVKKYFYVLRPILACKWIEEDRGIVPMEFNKLVDGVAKDPILKSEIALLVERKKSGKELDRGPKIPVISDFIERELDRLTMDNNARPAIRSDIEVLDELFRNALVEVWGNST
jgi:hypothetical protein